MLKFDRFRFRDRVCRLNGVHLVASIVLATCLLGCVRNQRQESGVDVSESIQPTNGSLETSPLPDATKRFRIERRCFGNQASPHELAVPTGAILYLTNEPTHGFWIKRFDDAVEHALPEWGNEVQLLTADATRIIHYQPGVDRPEIGVYDVLLGTDRFLSYPAKFPSLTEAVLELNGSSSATIITAQSVGILYLDTGNSTILDQAALEKWTTAQFVEISPDGNRLLYGTAEGALRISAVAGNDTLTTLPLSRVDLRPTFPQWASDSQRILVVDRSFELLPKTGQTDIQIKILDAVTGAQIDSADIWSLATGFRPIMLSWSPTGRYVAMWTQIDFRQGSSNRDLDYMAVVDFTRNELIDFCQTVDVDQLHPSQGFTFFALWSPDEEYLVVPQLSSSGSISTGILRMSDGSVVRVPPSDRVIGWAP